MHGHVGPFYGCYLPSLSVERMRHRLKRCGVRRIVCSHHSALACDVERGNRLMQEIVAAHPDRVPRLLGHQPELRPRSPHAILRSVHRLTGFVGLKFWPDYHLVPVTSPKYAHGAGIRRRARPAGSGAHLRRKPVRCAGAAGRSGREISAGAVPDGALGLRRMGNVGRHRPRLAERLSRPDERRPGARLLADARRQPDAPRPGRSRRTSTA